MQLNHASIAHAAADAVRAMIVDGRLADGARVNEVHLARDLGVSRTPLREALSALAAEGALTARPRLGFYVRPLSREEFEQLYDMRPLLDPEALRLSGIPSQKHLDRLSRANAALASCTGAAAIEKDDAWHFELIRNCPNTVLLDLIGNIMLRTRRYELALMREADEVVRAVEDHDAILTALRHGDLDAACLALKHNMRSGKAPILAWLAVRAPTKIKGRRL
jgi:DNA-binding GntR family transcriptional regulator